MLNKRKSGVLLHITSLPSDFGIGDLGPAAYRFADFLKEAGQSCWLILPLNEPSLKGENSPYHSLSAFSGNTLLISPELLLEEGWIKPDELKSPADFPQNKVDYQKAVEYKSRIMDIVFKRFRSGKKAEGFGEFCLENSGWLSDFALYKILNTKFEDRDWNEWPPELRDRNEAVLKEASREFSLEIEKEKFLQYLFFRQWGALKNYCQKKGIQLIGDMAIYVEHESADAWKNPNLFKLDENKKPLFVSGVPPDYFSKTGQLWGHPVYDWEALEQTDFAWWIQRIEHHVKLYDILRIDHFRGFVGYWEVDAQEKTAINGKWVKAPAMEFFNTLRKKLPAYPIIAEDLGVITADVKEVMKHFDFPGMRVLLFAFGEDNPLHPYLPHNFIENCVVFTGTHDTNTARGWFENEASQDDKERLFRYLGKRIGVEEVAWELIRLAMESTANLAIIPMQDILKLGGEARMNRPAIPKGNWLWCLKSNEITPSLAHQLFQIASASGRLPPTGVEPVF